MPWLVTVVSFGCLTAVYVLNRMVSKMIIKQDLARAKQTIYEKLRVILPDWNPSLPVAFLRLSPLFQEGPVFSDWLCCHHTKWNDKGSSNWAGLRERMRHILLFFPNVILILANHRLIVCWTARHDALRANQPPEDPMRRIFQNQKIWCGTYILEYWHTSYHVLDIINLVTSMLTLRTLRYH